MSKNPIKNTKMKSKFSEKPPKKDKSPMLLTKVVVRRLPPSMTEEMFVEAVAPLPEHDYFAFINADSSLGSSAYSRAYINFKHVEDVYIFRDKFDGYVFVDQKGNEHPAMVEYAPFQKIPKRSGGKKKDARCGTIDEDADYVAFLETLTKPVTITLPPLEAVLEEIQAHDRELKANNGVIKVKTPLLEYIEQRKAEKLRSKEEKKEERRRKEFERKKARDEERKRKKEVREHQREMKKEQKDDSSVKVLRPERGKEDYIFEGRQEKSKAERDKERQKREEEKMKLRKEKEKIRREREKEERLRRLEEKAKQREEEKLRQKEECAEDVQEEKVPASKPEGSKSKRYSEGRRKEREKDKMKEEKDREKKCKEEQNEMEVEVLEDESVNQGKAIEKEETESSRKEERSEEKPITRKRREKDPRVERRIRNKDRPAMALYRPGQSRLSSRMRQDREEGVETSSSSPSPVMPAGTDQKKSPPPSKKENTESSRSDYKKEDMKKTRSGSQSSIEENPPSCKSENDKDAEVDEIDSVSEKKDTVCDEREGSSTSIDEGDEKQKDARDDDDDDKDRDGDDDESSPGVENKTEEEESVGSVSKDAKKYPGVKSMTFRRSVSRE